MYRIFQILIVGGFIGGILVGWHFLTDPARFPIRVVKLQAEHQHVDRRQLQQQIIPFVRQGFFGLNEAHLRRSLSSQLPWIAKVESQRVWPNQVIIKITERKPAVRWGDTKFIDVSGQLFTAPPDRYTQNLPLLNGPESEQKQVWGFYQTMARLLAPLRLTVVKLAMDERQALSAVLSNGTQMFFGTKESLPRLQRFVKVYPQIFTRAEAQAERIDLRYENGLAVKWRDN